MPDPAGDGGSCRWQDDVDPAWRHRVLEKILGKLMHVYEGKLAPSHDLNRIATSFEQKMFLEANSKEDYIKRIAHKLLIMERNRQLVVQDASGHNQMQPVNPSQTIHGGNSSSTAMPQVSPTMSSQEGQSPHKRNLPSGLSPVMMSTPSGSSPVPKQHMSSPIAPNMQIKNGPTDDVMLDQILKSSPAIVTLSSPGVHPTQLKMQSGESQNQKKLPAMQMKPINISRGSVTSVTQPQGQSVVQLNGQQNPLRHNTKGTCMLPQQKLRMDHQGLEVNQQKMNRQNSQMPVAQQSNVSKMQTGHPREGNNHQNAGLNVASPLQTDKHVSVDPQLLITVNQQSSLHASLESGEEVDWREEMFKQMKVLKDAYLSELVELDEASVVPKITKEEFESLPKDKAEQYRFRMYMKKRIRTMLTFLQLQKSNIPEHLKGQLPMFVKAIQNVLGFCRRNKDHKAEMDTGHQSQSSHSKSQIVNPTSGPATSTGYKSSQQKQPVQSVAFHLRQNIATRTQAASGENHSNMLLGVTSSCVPARSPGSVSSLPSNKLKDYCTPSLVTKESPAKVSSPSASAKSILASPIAKPSTVIGASSSVSSPIDKPDLKVVSPSALVKSTLPSPTLPDLKVGVAQVASPSPHVKSALSTLGANSGLLLAASTCASMKPTSSENLGTVSSLLQQNNAAAATSNGSTTNLLMPSSLPQAGIADFQAKDLQHGGGKMAVAKKPIERLIDAMRSLPPEALKSSTNSICSVISMDDYVADGELNKFPHWTFFSKQGGSQPLKRMKRSFDIWEVEANAEHGGNSEKTQNARSALLDEIESANSTLMDTIISISDDNRTDGIISTSGGTLIELIYTAVSLAPDLKSLLATSEMPIVMPTKLFIPADYPRRSPELVSDQRVEQLRNTFSNDISCSADAAFRSTLNGIPEPRSIRETVRVWDACVRRAVTEFAQRFGGGMFSCKYGGWQSCGGA